MKNAWNIFAMYNVVHSLFLLRRGNEVYFFLVQSTWMSGHLGLTLWVKKQGWGLGAEALLALSESG